MFSGRLDSVQHRHNHIHHHHVRIVTSGQFKSLSPAGRLSDHLEVGLAVPDGDCRGRSFSRSFCSSPISEDSTVTCNPDAPAFALPATPLLLSAPNGTGLPDTDPGRDGGIWRWPDPAADPEEVQKRFFFRNRRRTQLFPPGLTPLPYFGCRLL